MPPLTNPANTIKSTNFIYDSKRKLFGEQIKQGASFEQIMCVIDALFENAFKGQSFDCIDLKELGIGECPDPNKSKQCQIIEFLVSGLKETNTTMNNLQQVFQQVKSTIGAFADEKVKINIGGKAGYLSDFFSGNAPNTIKYKDDQVLFYGLVPVGFRGTVSRDRLSDFDNTGKGKAGTDLWGWAIRNGNNGLQNHLGLFPMYTDDVQHGDMTGGKDSFTVSAANIGTLALVVTGTITEALENDVKFHIQLGSRNKCFGIGGCRDVLVPDPGADKNAETEGKNFKHTHPFNLAATHTNPSPTPIELIPKHIKEIPIERIIV